MKTTFNCVLVGALLAIATAVASAADPVIGTWKLNLAKSTFSPGPAPKSQTRSYAESPQGIVLTTKTVAADGKESTISLTFKDDGKPYAVTGSPDFDAVSVRRVNARTVKSTQTRAGAPVGSGVRTVSEDGKALTFEQKGTHVGGGKYDDVLVYDRE
jgi:uncharacterized Zn-binding protein involved in type VI secretion